MFLTLPSTFRRDKPLPGDGLLLRGRPADAALQVRGPASGGHGQVLHHGDGPGHRLGTQVKIRAQRHQARQRPLGCKRPHQVLGLAVADYETS